MMNASVFIVLHCGKIIIFKKNIQRVQGVKDFGACTIMMAQKPYFARIILQKWDWLLVQLTVKYWDAIIVFTCMSASKA